MTPTEALSLLYSSAVKSEHPDTAARVVPSMADLMQARDVLRQLVAHAGEVKSCVLCSGTGRVRVREFMTRECSACKGTGETT